MKRLPGTVMKVGSSNIVQFKSLETTWRYFPASIDAAEDYYQIIQEKKDNKSIGTIAIPSQFPVMYAEH